MKCCDKIEKLGCFDSCKSVIQTGLIADIVGVWSYEIDYMGISRRTEFEVFGMLPMPTPLGGTLLNTEIKIINTLNEDYEYILRVYKPDGTLYKNTFYSFKIHKVICN